MNCNKKFKLSRAGLLSACIAAAMHGQEVLGAENNSLENELIEEIVVQASYRASLMKARDLKRDAVGSRDSIVAEDIADFPDLNLAESLQRIPGVTITREGGEGRQISLRGLGPDFTNVELNGMQVLGNTSSPMDSRGAVTRNRAFDFNIFASELFNRIDVHKSYSATLDEGGIGGTVGLYTAKPFDKEGFQSALTGQLGTNEFTDDTSPRVAALISNTWGETFGALASVAYSKRDTVERGYNTFRWRQVSRTNFNDDGTPSANPQYSADLDATTRQLLEDGELWFARGNRFSVWENEQERLGITTAFQFRPNEDLAFGLDILYGKLSNSRQEWHLPTNGAGSTALGFVEDLQYVDNNGDLEVIYGEFSNVGMRTESRRDEADTTFKQFVLNGEWILSDRTVIRGLIGTEESEFDQPVLDKAYFQTPDGVGITTDFRGDRFYATNTYDFDTAAADSWEVRELDLREEFISSKFDNVKVDVEFDLTDTSTLKYGASYKSFENEGWARASDDFVRLQDTPLNNGVTTIGDYAFVYTDHPDANWLAADVSDVQAFYGINANLSAADNLEGSAFTIEEDTTAAYVQYEWLATLADMPLRGNIGLRYYSTDITSKGELVEGAVSFTQDYSGVLPALNLALDLTEELVVRASISKNLTRPELSALSAAGRVDPDATGSNPFPRVRAGNPDLDPFESINYETSLEWYFDDIGFVALGAFYKDIENFVVFETVRVPYGETGFPLELLLEGQDASTLFDFTRPVNTDDTTIKGVELAFQREFDFLPEPFNGLGVIANYTYADGEALYRNVQNTGEDVKKSFPGLSPHSWNLTFYYEGNNWGARVATAYRDEYISLVEGGLADEDERGFHETTNVDFSAFYQINEQLKLTFEGINLTDETEEQYSDSSDRAYNTTNSGTSYYLGASYKF